MEITAVDGKAVGPGEKIPAGRHEVGPNLRGHQVVKVKAHASESDQLAYDLTATVEPDGTGTLVVTRLVAEQVAGGPPVQRGELAKISVEPFVRFAAQTVLRVEPDRVGTPGPPDAFWDRVAEKGLADSDLPDLAKAYRWIRLQEGRPTAVLAQELGISTATVRRWLAKAVSAGYLTQDERTK